MFFPVILIFLLNSLITENMIIDENDLHTDDEYTSGDTKNSEEDSDGVGGNDGKFF